MPNANCLDKDGEFKLCPFRTFKEQHFPVLKGNGEVVTEQFYPCMGEECIAYHVGICLRLSDAADNLHNGQLKQIPLRRGYVEDNSYG